MPVRTLLWGFVHGKNSGRIYWFFFHWRESARFRSISMLTDSFGHMFISYFILFLPKYWRTAGGRNPHTEYVRACMVYDVIQRIFIDNRRIALGIPVRAMEMALKCVQSKYTSVESPCQEHAIPQPFAKTECIISTQLFFLKNLKFLYLCIWILIGLKFFSTKMDNVNYTIVFKIIDVLTFSK